MLVDHNLQLYHDSHAPLTPKRDWPWSSNLTDLSVTVNKETTFQRPPDGALFPCRGDKSKSFSETVSNTQPMGREGENKKKKKWERYAGNCSLKIDNART